MDLKELILNTLREKEELTVAEIARATDFSRSYVHRFFQSLVEEGKILRIGHANRSRYVLAKDAALRKVRGKFWNIARTFENKGLKEDEVLSLIKKETGIFDNLADNVSRILEYAFTEMLNNAIEHSKSAKIKVIMKRDSAGVRFDVIDWGIGIFENMIHVRHLASTEEAIQDLLKGKQTTDPEHHSGEGIFFTRRASDTFIIRSSTKKLFFNNVRDDFTITPIQPLKGTRVTFTISASSKRELRSIFERFSVEDFKFGVTEASVRLYKPGGTRDFISRSQARRILTGLEKFEKIILDFDGVIGVGQSFADETFRVFKNRYPHIVIQPIHMNDEVRFMVERTKQS